MAASILQKYYARLQKEGITSLTAQSREWFIDMLASGDLKATQSKMLKDQVTITRSTPRIGKMYMFVYNPKLKKSLPYYDKFPLILLADFPEEGKGFYGLNLHYLRPIQRAIFFQKLVDAYSTASAEKLTENSKLRISYSILKSAAKHKAFRPTFKRYLPNFIKSQILEIPAPYWETAIFLPTQNFAKATSSKVWSDSRLMIGSN